MKRNFAMLAIILFSLSACKKYTKTACGTQVCTDVFASVGVHFADKNNNPISVTNYTVVDLRTNLAITHAVPEGMPPNAGYMVIANDGDLKLLSTDGDNIRVTATNPNTQETLNANFKISGGCNCHVAKLSGPDTIKFN